MNAPEKSKEAEISDSSAVQSESYWWLLERHHTAVRKGVRKM